jgi:(4S)-4-hydroxy-5-phosphonooxypentane-2,3-dione isomerase
MRVLIVKIQIKPEFRTQFLQSMVEVDARGSNEDEPGCLRFDVVQDESDPNTVWLYEVYRDQAAFQEHTKAPHYIKWRDTVEDWYAAPSEVARGSNLYPTDDSWR